MNGSCSLFFGMPNYASLRFPALIVRSLIFAPGPYDRARSLLAQYRDITQDEFLPEVTSSEKVVVHFYHKDFQR